MTITDGYGILMVWQTVLCELHATAWLMPMTSLSQGTLMHREVPKAHSQSVAAAATAPGLGSPVPTLSTTLEF